MTKLGYDQNFVVVNRGFTLYPMMETDGWERVDQMHKCNNPPLDLPHSHCVWAINGVPGKPPFQKWSRRSDQKTFHLNGVQALEKPWDKCIICHRGLYREIKAGIYSKNCIMLNQKSRFDLNSYINRSDQVLLIIIIIKKKSYIGRIDPIPLCCLIVQASRVLSAGA